MKSQTILRKEKIFILLDKASKSNPILDYGLKLAARMRFSASLLAFKEEQQQALTNLLPSGLSPFGARSMDIFAEKVSPIPLDNQLSRESSRLWSKLQYELGREANLNQVLLTIQEEDAFLLVLEGSNPKHKLQEILGTFDTRLAGATDLPVLILPPSTSWKGVDKLLFIMDAEDLNRKPLKTMYTLSKRLEARLEVVMISEEAMGQSEGNFLLLRENIHQEFPDVNLSFHKIYGEQNLEEVQILIEATEADWLVFEKKDRNLFDRLFDSYHNHKLIQESPIPCLVF
ncbi:MAG: hypothetical protein R8P61_32660 [Bacteroidia bacterium]|nr:hypothetical protein [Bacteroidia bacterium]